MTEGPQASQELWSRLGAFVATTLGLHFPPKRWRDLQRGFAPAARELGFDDAKVCIRWLLSQPAAAAAVQVLANHLTIGETYFFRDRPALDALAANVLPALIRARRGQRQQLRLWCAACCTGEEAYTLAIMLHRLLPDLLDWNIVIAATDVNTLFLEKARAGTYGEWSFRDAPHWLKPRYFERNANGSYTVLPAVRRLVAFSALNLVDGAERFQRTDLRAMDVIVCRNALMYFTPQQAARTLGHLWQSLVAHGWLIVAPGEVPRTQTDRFEAVGYPGAILFQKKDAVNQALPMGRTASPAPSAVSMDGLSAGRGSTPAARDGGERTPAAPVAMAQPAHAPTTPALEQPSGTVVLARQARACANQGRLADALACCDRWLEADKLATAGHYLRAVVLLEQGDVAPAQASLERALYLDGGFVMAHFALGNIARNHGDHERAGKHFANARRLLRRYRTDALLPESDGLTADRLAETLRLLTVSEGVS